LPYQSLAVAGIFLGETSNNENGGETMWDKMAKAVERRREETEQDQDESHAVKNMWSITRQHGPVMFYKEFAAGGFKWKGEISPYQPEGMTLRVVGFPGQLWPRLQSIAAIHLIEEGRANLIRPEGVTGSQSAADYFDQVMQHLKLLVTA
jgi:hypothetical protein